MQVFFSILAALLRKRSCEKSNGTANKKSARNFNEWISAGLDFRRVFFSTLLSAEFHFYAMVSTILPQTIFFDRLFL